MNALDRLLLEAIPTRPTPARRDNSDGPTAQWLKLEQEREKWRVINEVSGTDQAAGAA